jgi:hypothetical protein
VTLPLQTVGKLLSESRVLVRDHVVEPGEQGPRDARPEEELLVRVAPGHQGSILQNSPISAENFSGQIFVHNFWTIFNTKV